MSAMVDLSLLPRRVAMLTLQSGPVNAMTWSMGEQFGAAVRSLHDKPISALIITGKGKSYSAGGDLDFLRSRAAASQKENIATMLAFYKLYLGPIRSLAIPVISCVHGDAVGAGACLATACDFRFVNKNSRVGFTFTSGVAIHPGMGGTHFLPQVVGPQNASRLLLAGELVSGSEIAGMGWGFACVDAEETRTKAVALAEALTATAPVAASLTLGTLRAKCDEGLEAALLREATAQAICYSGRDFLEGVEAVASKKKPGWTQY
jgi:enoyl-CoA hydratase